jgi:hypothetical protein
MFGMKKQSKLSCLGYVSTLLLVLGHLAPAIINFILVDSLPSGKVFVTWLLVGVAVRQKCSPLRFWMILFKKGGKNVEFIGKNVFGKIPL